jgi:hypothetical protein
MPLVDFKHGIIILPPEFELGPWERKSLPLVVSRAYEQLFSVFREYFATEMEALGDGTLKQELDVLERLRGAGTPLERERVEKGAVSDRDLEMARTNGTLFACQSDAECVPVKSDCFCSCSGCGGIDYDTVINVKYRDAWQRALGCSKELTKARFCPMVCCPKVQPVCENNRCAAERVSP